MKNSIVPAQVTDIQDRVAGSLTLTQLGLLVLPIFIGLTLYLMPPDGMHIDTVKLVAMTTSAIICCISAVRFKKRTIAVWAIALLRYHLKPKTYVFDKNYGRTRIEKEATEYIETPTQKTHHQPPPVIRHAYLMPELDVNFVRSKKGGLDVHITDAA